MDQYYNKQGKITKSILWYPFRAEQNKKNAVKILSFML